METMTHDLQALFQQLGLDSSHEAIANFVQSNGPLPKSVSLEAANFWTQSQSRFLTEAIQQDSDWAEVVDELNVMLR